MDEQIPAPSSPAPVVTTGTGRSVWKIWLLRAVLAVVVLGLIAAAAYGGYYWEHGRAVVVEHELQHKVDTLQAQLDKSAPRDQTAASADTAACLGSDLTLAEVTSSGAAGTTGVTYSVTNSSSVACTLSGFPTVTLASSGGQQLGQAAAHDGAASSTVITLHPGEKAFLTVLYPNPDNFDAGVCSAFASAIRVALASTNDTTEASASGHKYCPGFATQVFTTIAP